MAAWTRKAASMNRLLRKYNRILLAVFGAGLMVVFLMPQLPDLMAQFGGRGSLIATMGEDGKPVTREEWRLVQQQVEILQRIQRNLPPIPIIGSIGNDPQRYFLLIHEAERAGMIGGDASAGIDPDTLLQLAQQTGFPPAAIRQTLINYAGIRRYLAFVSSSGQLSDRRLRLGARKMLDGVNARYLVIPAKAKNSKIIPDEAAQLKQFQMWADTEAGEGDHGFGYRLPARATIEWLEIPRQSVVASVQREIESDDLEVRKFWRRNQGRFTAVDPEGDLPDEVRSAYVEETVDELMPKIARAATDSLRAPRRGFASSENFVVLPEDWAAKRLDLGLMRTQLAERFALPLDGEAALPIPSSSDPLLDMDSIAQLPGIGQAGTDRFGRGPNGQSRRLADLIGSAREFGGGGEVPVQNGLAGPVIEDARGNMWIFRVIDADPARPPVDLDEVRPQVIADLQRHEAWNDLRGRISALESVADQGGIDLISQQEEIRLEPARAFQRNLHPTIPRPPVVRGLGEDQGVIDQVVDRSIELGSEPLNTIEARDRTLILPSEDNMALIAVELTSRQPLSPKQFELFHDQGVLASRIRADELGGLQLEALAPAFTTEALGSRHGFTFIGAEEEEDTTNTASAE